MIRPFGKSPASSSKSKRSQVDLQRLSIIDVSAEDDSLLPSAKKSLQGTSHNVPHSPSETRNLKMCPVAPDDRQESERMPACGEPGQETDALSPLEVSAKKKKKKTGHFNLRKSLAWNHAFFTEEGVLDPEELSLVNRTFKKPPDLPKPISHKQPTRTPTRTPKLAKPPMIPRIDLSLTHLEKPSLTVDSRQIKTNGSGSALCSPRSSTGSITGSANDHPVKKGKGPTGLTATKQVMGISSSRIQAEPVKQVKPMFAVRSDCIESKPILPKRLVENNAKKAVGPPVPDGEKGASTIARSAQSLSKTVSSVSRKMKDKFGMVLLGHSNGNQKEGTPRMSEDDSKISACSPNVSYLGSSVSAKVPRCFSQSSFDRFGRSTVVATSLESVSSNGAFCSEPTTIESGSSDQLERMAEKSSLDVSALGGLSSHRGSALKSPSVLDAGVLSQRKANMDSAPSVSLPQSQEVSSSAQLRLEVSESSWLHQENPFAKIEPNSSKKHTQLGGGSGTLLYRAKPSGLRMPSPKLGFFDTAKAITAPQVAVLRERNCGLGFGGVAVQSGRNTLSNRSPSEGGGITNMQQNSRMKVHGNVGKSEAGLGVRGIAIPCGIPAAPHLRGSESTSRVSSSSNLAHSALSSNSSHYKTDSTVCSKGQALQFKKNKENKEYLSPEENASTASPFRTEGKTNGSDPRTSSIAAQEWPLVKSGAVQHSPPDKIPLLPGPWSPVRKNGQQLGPFDCTKCVTTGTAQ